VPRDDGILILRKRNEGGYWKHPKSDDEPYAVEIGHVASSRLFGYYVFPLGGPFDGTHIGPFKGPRLALVVYFTMLDHALSPAPIEVPDINEHVAKLLGFSKEEIFGY